MTTEQDLRAVLELSERATPGEWRHDVSMGQVGSIETGAGDVIAQAQAMVGRHSVKQRDDNAALIAAAVNLLRQHGSALLRAVEDARRYQWLRENESNREDVFLSYCREELDAAIDAVIAEGDQA